VGVWVTTWALSKEFRVGVVVVSGRFALGETQCEYRIETIVIQFVGEVSTCEGSLALRYYECL